MGSLSNLRGVDEVLIAQWRRLREWLADEDVLSRTDLPVGLGDWVVGDLVAHLGLGLRLVTGIGPATDDVRPITLGEYVAAYPPAAGAIAGQTEELQVELGADVLAGLDAIAAEAFAHLADVTTPVVLARRGPITRDDYVRTRLLELVVHGDDLARALHTSTHPGTQEAVGVVASALAAAYREVARQEPAQHEPLAWIRLAAGRTVTDDPRLPLL